jgi:hypothetical protein
MKGLDVLEPGFYHRIETDLGISVPNPHMVSIDVGSLANHVLKHVEMAADKATAQQRDTKEFLMAALVDKLLSDEHNCEPRLVLDLFDSGDQHSVLHRGKPIDIYTWAKDSVSSWGDGVIDKRGYVFMPYLPETSRLMARGSAECDAHKHTITAATTATTTSSSGSGKSRSTSPISAVDPADIAGRVGICPEFLRREMSDRACFNKCT